MSKLGEEGATPREEGTGLTARTSRPLVSPDMYSGIQSWSDWVEHFEATASVNGWSETTKPLWLPVRFSGKAQTAWKRLTPDAKSSYATAKEVILTMHTVTYICTGDHMSFSPAGASIYTHVRIQITISALK